MENTIRRHQEALVQIRKEREALDALSRDFKAGVEGWQVKHRDTILGLRRWVESWPIRESDPS